MNKVVIGVVENRTDAEVVMFNLRNAGIRADDVSVLLPDKSGSNHFAHEYRTKAPEGAIAGVGAGGVLGGTLGLLVGVGTLAIPGLGPLIAAGPLMAALSGAAAGAAALGLTGALVGLGIPEIEAKHYEGKIKGGNILIAVHTETKDARNTAEGVLKRAGAHDISSMSETSAPDPRASRPDS